MNKADVLSLDGRQLRLFLAVHDLQSVTRAADELDLSQSAVSHGLDRLRLLLDDPLFVKKGRGITPTPVARDLAPRIRSLLAQFEGLSFKTDFAPETDTSAVTIAANVNEMLPLLIEISRAIRAEAANMTIRMIDLGSPLKAADVLENGAADLVVTLQATPLSPQINTATLYKTGHLCFYDPTCTTAPQTLEQYLAAPHGVLDFGRNADSILGVALREQGLHRNIKLAAANSQVLAALMRGTPVLATLPEPLARTSFAGFASARPPAALDLQPVVCRMHWHKRVDASGKHLWLSQLVREAAANI